MDLPSFIWLWRIAAWSMGLALTTYCLLALSGGFLYYTRLRTTRLYAQSPAAPSPAGAIPPIEQPLNRPIWLRPLHYLLGGGLVFLVILLLSIGVIGTLGEYGDLGHSVHLPAGLVVVTLTLASAWCASRISPERPWARKAHLIINGTLLVAFSLVTATGWSVVQKYL